MQRTPWGLKGGLLAAALSLTLPAIAEPPKDPPPTAEKADDGSRPQRRITAYGHPPIPDPKPPRAQDMFEAMLTGTWSGSGHDGDRMGWSLTYTIHSGSYTLEGYPPLREVGDIAVASPPVVEANGDIRFTVHFTHRVMNDTPAEDRTEAWVLSADKQRFTRPTDMTFTRTPTPPAPPTQDGSP